MTKKSRDAKLAQARADRVKERAEKAKARAEKLKAAKIEREKAKAAKAEAARAAMMTPRQFLAALGKLDLTVAGQATADALGIGIRQCQRIASGDQSVPRPVAKLIDLYLRHGLDA